MKKLEQSPLISIIPYDIFKTFETKLNQDLTYCKGVLERETHRDIWFGFVGGTPMRFTYRQSDQKTTWSTCDLSLVKDKIKSAKSQ